MMRTRFGFSVAGVLTVITNDKPTAKKGASFMLLFVLTDGELGSLRAFNSMTSISAPDYTSRTNRWVGDVIGFSNRATVIWRSGDRGGVFRPQKMCFSSLILGSAKSLADSRTHSRRSVSVKGPLKLVGRGIRPAAKSGIRIL